MIQTLTYRVNVAPEGVPPVVRLSQNENGRQLVFDLGGSGVVDIPAGAVVTISGTKPDGVVYSATGTMDGTNAVFNEDTQMTAVAGEWDAKIRVTYNGATIATVKIWFAIDSDPVEAGAVPSDSELEGLVAEAQQYAESARSAAYGSPLTAATAAAMTDTSKVYVYTGSETGYTAGHWYYYNGTAWTDGGVYQSAGVQTDTTLTVAGMPADAKATGDEIADLKDALDVETEAREALADRVTAIENEEGLHRYGVSGIGQAASQLTRLWDAVGMTAQVGTDGDNSAVVNNFDDVTPFNRRKCVGTWHKSGSKAVFHVHAYYGDEDYTEDGSNGDYVAVECPRAYYYFKNGVLGVSAHHWPEWRPFDIFCRDHNPDDTMEYCYLPAYALATNEEGKAVCLPGYDNEQGAYKQLVDAARTYKGGELGNLAIIQPAAVNFYEWALFTVEFARQDGQQIMFGAAFLRHSNDDRVTFKDATHVITNNYQATRVPMECVAIITATIDINHSGYKATHRIVSVTRCDADGTPNTTGTHQLLELEDLGKTYFVYDTTGTTEYRLAARPYRTGDCNGVSTPSGSPVSNTSGHYPMKYRHRENVYANQYHTVMDLFNKRVGSGDDDYFLEWYFLPDPSVYEPSASGKPDATDLATDAFELLDIETDHAHYVNGWIKSKLFSGEYPDLWIPYEENGSNTTYYADYASLVSSSVVRAVRLGGLWLNGSNAGFSAAFAYYAPGAGTAVFGADLCMIQ